jgi:hypothetical protein
VGLTPFVDARALGGCGRLGRGFDDPSSTERESCSGRSRYRHVLRLPPPRPRRPGGWPELQPGQRDVLVKHAGRHVALGLDLNARHRTEANVLERFGVALNRLAAFIARTLRGGLPCSGPERTPVR